MNKWLFLFSLTSILILLSARLVYADDETDFYQRCASCHLENGKGVEGAFPPLRGHIDRFFETPDGRGYLVHIILHGLQGQINVKGTPYFGFMPNVVADLSADELRVLLDDLVQRFGTPTQKTQGPLFDKIEIERVLQKRQYNPTELKKLRQKVLANK